MQVSSATTERDDRTYTSRSSILWPSAVESLLVAFLKVSRLAWELSVCSCSAFLSSCVRWSSVSMSFLTPPNRSRCVSISAVISCGEYYSSGRTRNSDDGTYCSSRNCRRRRERGDPLSQLSKEDHQRASTESTGTGTRSVGLDSELLPDILDRLDNTRTTLRDTLDLQPLHQFPIPRRQQHRGTYSLTLRLETSLTDFDTRHDLLQAARKLLQLHQRPHIARHVCHPRRCR